MFLLKLEGKFMRRAVFPISLTSIASIAPITFEETERRIASQLSLFEPRWLVFIYPGCDPSPCLSVACIKLLQQPGKDTRGRSHWGKQSWKHYTITLTCSADTVTYPMNKSHHQGPGVSDAAPLFLWQMSASQFLSDATSLFSLLCIFFFLASLTLAASEAELPLFIMRWCHFWIKLLIELCWGELRSTLVYSKSWDWQWRMACPEETVSCPLNLSTGAGEGSVSQRLESDWLKHQILRNQPQRRAVLFLFGFFVSCFWCVGPRFCMDWSVQKQLTMLTILQRQSPTCLLKVYALQHTEAQRGGRTVWGVVLSNADIPWREIVA